MKRMSTLLATCALGALACASGDETAGDRAAAAPARDRPGPAKTGPQPRVVIELDAGKTAAVDVEVVRTQRDIRRGLMYRTHMPADAGMLFLFKREKFQGFWMKNTLISLDMIFIGANMKVAGLIENTVPRSPVSRSVRAPSQFVLEVNAGWSAKHGLKAGAPVRFENVPNVPPPWPLGAVAPTAPPG